MVFSTLCDFYKEVWHFTWVRFWIKLHVSLLKLFNMIVFSLSQHKMPCSILFYIEQMLTEKIMKLNYAVRIYSNLAAITVNIWNFIRQFIQHCWHFRCAPRMQFPTRTVTYATVTMKEHQRLAPRTFVDKKSSLWAKDLKSSVYDSLFYTCF